MSFVICCGGTGGHLLPGRAVAERLEARGREAVLWVTGRDVESRCLSGWTGGVHRMAAVRSGAIGLLSLPAAVLAARRALRAANAEVLLAMGSQSSLAPVVAARGCGIPVILHEANGVPGRAVEILSHLARTVAVSWQQTRGRWPRWKVVVTGYPVRCGLVERYRALSPRPDHPFTVLVVGGSQGARRLNESVPDAIGGLVSSGTPAAVIHLSGPTDEGRVREAYVRAGVNSARVQAFETDMAAVYALADVAVCRAGAGTCSELLVCGIPAILVPYPHAVRDHQTANARILVEWGAAELLPEDALTAAGLADRLRDLAEHPQRREAMRQAALRHAPEDAADRVADLLVAVAERGRCRQTCRSA